MTQFVYVAGPYTKGDVAVNVRKAILAGDALARLGFAAFIPHLTHFWHLVCPHEITFWYAQDLHWLGKCDFVVRLSGESTGADNEIERARLLDIPVYIAEGEFSVADFDALTRPYVSP